MSASPYSQFFRRSAVIAIGLTALFVACSWEALFATAEALAANQAAVDEPGITPAAIIANRFTSRDRPTTPASPRPGLLTRPAPVATALEAELLRAPEVGLDRTGSRERLFRERTRAEHPALAMMDRRDDLRGLPILRGESCQGPPFIATVSRSLRVTVGVADAYFQARRASFTRGGEELPVAVRRDIALAAEPRPMLIWQLCQCEPKDVRATMLDVLQRIDRPGAGEAIARAALFDSDADVRRAAATTLRSRSLEEYRSVLLAGFRHPWPPAADHAATTLAALNDRRAVPHLIKLLDAPDPAAPSPDETGTLVVREMVRINHARNCQMCHAPSWDANDVARAPVPSPDVPLAPSFTPDYGVPCPDAFIKVDVTYLRPDFSLLLPVSNPGVWPDRQRFDFLVRTRPATEAERAAPKAATYFQREVVLRTLQKLTGEKTGDDVAAWQEYAKANYRTEE